MRRRRYQLSDLKRALTMYEPNPRQLPRAASLGAVDQSPIGGPLLMLVTTVVGFVVVSSVYSEIRSKERRRTAHQQYLSERGIAEPSRLRI